MDALAEISNLHNHVNALMPKATAELAAALNELDKHATAMENKSPRDTVQSFNSLNGAFANAFNILEQTDMPPTQQVVNAVITSQAELKKLQLKWMDIKTKELPQLNDALKKAGLPVIQL
jgi:hypothetical protein